jgi:transposase InsO family protein
MSHANARLNEYGRNLVVQRCLAGHRVKDVAAQVGVSRSTVYKWIRRFAAEGVSGLADRSSRPHRSPRRVSFGLELIVLAARLDRHVGPVQLAANLKVPASTIGAILRRWSMPRLVEVDRITGELLRTRATDVRYEHPRPGDLLHIDVKKLGRIPDGGGWRLDGSTRAAIRAGHSRDRDAKTGFDYIHVAIDDHTRIVYAEIHPDEKGTTCAAFLHRAVQHFLDAYGVTIRRILTDNAYVYRRSFDWIWICHALQIARRFIKPGCPWTNGKAERFNRTLATEWAYAQPWTSTTERNAAFDTFIDHYNTQRGHTAAGGRPPISRLNA